MEKLKCAVCGRSVPDDRHTCKHCGFPAEASKSVQPVPLHPDAPRMSAPKLPPAVYIPPPRPSFPPYPVPKRSRSPKRQTPPAIPAREKLFQFNDRLRPCRNMKYLRYLVYFSLPFSLIWNIVGIFFENRAEMPKPLFYGSIVRLAIIIPFTVVYWYNLVKMTRLAYHLVYISPALDIISGIFTGFLRNAAGLSIYGLIPSIAVSTVIFVLVYIYIHKRAVLFGPVEDYAKNIKDYLKKQNQSKSK